LDGMKSDSFEIQPSDYGYPISLTNIAFFSVD